MSVFLDSYAIVEMARGNPRYDPIEEEPVATSVWNLLESYYILSEAGDERTAASSLAELGPVAEEVPKELIPAIARFRREERGTTGRKFSYADAAGYVYARDRGLTFVTGAHEFEGLPGVWFLR